MIIEAAQLSYNEADHSFRTQLRLDDRDVSVTCFGKQGEEINQVAEALSGIVMKIFTVDDDIKKYCADQLLKDKNENWTEENNEKVTEEQFKRRLHLQRITRESDDSTVLTYVCGNLFWGHDVVVGADAAFHFTYATLEG